MERELIYRIKVIADDDNPTVLRGWVDARKAADKQIVESASRRNAELSKMDSAGGDESERAATRAFQARTALLDRQSREERRAGQERVTDEERRQGKISKVQQEAIARETQARSKLYAGFMQGVEATAKFTRGLALLGVASDKNLGRMAEHLVKIQGLFDLVVGGVKLAAAGGSIIQGLSKASEGGGGGLFGFARDAAANAAGDAVGEGAERFIGGGLPRLGKKAADPWAAGLARGGLAGAGAVSAGGGGAAATATTGIAALATTAAAAAAALVGVVGAGKAIVDMVRGREFEHDSWQAKGGEMISNAGAYAHKKTGGWSTRLMQIGTLGAYSGLGGPGMDEYQRMNDTDESNETAAKERERIMAQRFTRNELAKNRGQVDDLRFNADLNRDAFGRQAVGSLVSGRTNRNVGEASANRNAIADARAAQITAERPEDRKAAQDKEEKLLQRQTVIDQERYKLLDKQREVQAADEKRFRSRREDTEKQLAGATTDSDRERLAERAAQLAKEEADSAGRRYELEKSLIDEKRSVLRESIAAGERELELTQSRVRADKEKLTSAQERFGQMTMFEQGRAIEAKKKADAGLPLNRDELRSLRSVGTEDATKIARERDVAAAERAGFSKFFGKPERDRIAAGEESEKKLTLKLESERELIVSLDADEDRLVEGVKNDVAELVARRDGILLNKLERGLKELDAKINAMSQKQAAARAGLVGT